MDESENLLIKIYHEILVTKKNYISLELVVDQFIIRCNYADKFSYWKRETNLRKGNCMKRIEIK